MAKASLVSLYDIDLKYRNTSDSPDVYVLKFPNREQEIDSSFGTKQTLTCENTHRYSKTFDEAAAVIPRITDKAKGSLAWTMNWDSKIHVLRSIFGEWLYYKWITSVGFVDTQVTFYLKNAVTFNDLRIRKISFSYRRDFGESGIIALPSGKVVVGHDISQALVALSGRTATVTATIEEYGRTIENVVLMRLTVPEVPLKKFTKEYLATIGIFNITDLVQYLVSGEAIALQAAFNTGVCERKIEEGSTKYLAVFWHLCAILDIDIGHQRAKLSSGQFGPALHVNDHNFLPAIERVNVQSLAEI